MSSWKEKILTLLIGIIAITTGYLAINWAGGFVGVNETDKVQKIADDVKSIKQSLSPYEYKNTFNKIDLIEMNGFENTATENNQPTNTFEKNIEVSGQFKDGYLYAKVSVGQQQLNKWSDLYVKIERFINNKTESYGGHLITSKSLDTPQNKNYSEILFNLNDIKYKESYTDIDINIVSSDWLKFFNGSVKDSKIISFVSTTGNGKILELSIYYECVENSDCSIIPK